jgi:hypothetical protein
METLPKMYMKLRLQLSNGKDIFIRYIGNNLFISTIKGYKRPKRQNFELQLKHIQEKAELEKTMEERLRKFEEKLNGKGENNNVISDEMAQKAMMLFDKFLSK